VGESATFVYDGDGNRGSRTEGGETVIYVNRFYEKNLDTGTVTTYYYLGDRLVALRNGAALRYMHSDHLGGTNVVTDTSGNQDSKITYYPYGDCRNSTGTLETDRLFTGQRLDDTGLYYYNARYYDPTLGRFISPDPLVQSPMNPQSLNRYSYVFNNPLKYIDPSGRLTEDEIDETFGKGTAKDLQSKGYDKAWYNALRTADYGDVILLEFERGYIYYELTESGLQQYSTCGEESVAQQLISQEGNVEELARLTDALKHDTEFDLTLYSAVSDWITPEPQIVEMKGTWHLQTSWWDETGATWAENRENLGKSILTLIGLYGGIKLEHEAGLVTAMVFGRAYPSPWSYVFGYIVGYYFSWPYTNKIYDFLEDLWNQ
jgi:RHS repeat-associated protein